MTLYSTMFNKKEELGKRERKDWSLGMQDTLVNGYAAYNTPNNIRKRPIRHINIRKNMLTHKFTPIQYFSATLSRLERLNG